MAIRFEDEAVLRALNAARRDINSRVKDGLKTAVKEAGLPGAKVAAASLVAPYLTVGATQTRAFITTRGPKLFDRIAGLQEFGGTVTVPIFPKKALALSVAPGVMRAAVNKPRRYPAQRRISRSVERSLPKIAERARDDVVKAFGPLAT